MKDKIFYTVCFGFLLGALWRSFFNVDIHLILAFATISLALIFLFLFPPRSKIGIIFAVAAFSFCAGAVRFNQADVPRPPLLESYVGKKIKLIGEVDDEPRIKENSQQLILKLKNEGPAFARIIVTLGFGENYKYGDELVLAGTLQKPENFITDQGKEFDYINYLRKDGILYTMSYPSAEVLSRGNGNFLRGSLFKTKEKFLEKIYSVIGSPESLLLGGLILGEKSAFPEELRRDFVDTGTIHIVALSGYNVTIVAEWFMRLFSFLPFIVSIWAGIFAIFLFVLMTGAGSTATRAGVMSGLALIARATGRTYDAGRALVLAAALMVLWNPFILAFDVSFQLSFIATVAVIFFAPKMEQYFWWVTRNFGLRDIISVTTAAYIFVMPFILYKMGSFSVVALPANILVLPFIPPTMALGFLTGLAGLIWPMLSIPLGFVAGLLLSYELTVIGFLADLPFSAFSLSRFPLWATALIYACFIYKLFGKEISRLFSFLPE